MKYSTAFLTYCLLSLAPLLAGLANSSWAQEATKPDEKAKGHSVHGEVFNEGPRQKAYLMPGMAKLNFAITTTSPEAQQFFNQGVCQLHGFWYYEAERSFRQVALLDPNCAMAYWGMAQANLSNEPRAKKFMEVARKHEGTASEREKMYIDALDRFVKAEKDGEKNKQRHEDYTRALEKILYKFPDDLEGRAFLAVQFWKNRDAQVSIPSYIAVDAVLDQIFRVDPMHPVHHYRIHLWDQEFGAKALEAATKCGQSAPGIAHMWHMSGHIFSGLKRYDDAAWQQEASARVDHAHMMRDRVLPDQIHNFSHNNEWLIRDMLHIGRLHDSLDLAKNMCELPRHPKYNTLTKRGSTRFGRERLVEALTTYEDWAELISLTKSPYLDPAGLDEEGQLEQLRTIAKAQYRLGEIATADLQLAELQKKLAEQHFLQAKAVADAEAKAKTENKSPEEIAKARDEAKKQNEGQQKNWQSTIDELLGYQLLANRKTSEGYEQLKKVHKVNKGYIARLLVKTDKKDEAVTLAREYADGNKNEVVPQAWLVQVLWEAGKKDDAKVALEALREMSGQIDGKALASAPLKGIAAIAKELQLPEEWRVVKPTKTDVGDRPALDTLGPLRWRPSPAPSWSLKDAAGADVSLAQFQGKPVVLLFFLGHGCLHCAEQLRAFSAAKAEFDAAGLTLLAISSDDAEGLKQSLEDFKGSPIGIPLLADNTLETFKAYRCFDDFENQPLHGTFVIDGTGLVRWQDIGFEPFKDHRFVIDEAKRLLAHPVAAMP